MHAQTVDTRLSLSPAHQKPGYDARVEHVVVQTTHDYFLITSWHVRLDTRLSLLFCTASNRKLDGGLGTSQWLLELTLQNVNQKAMHMNKILWLASVFTLKKSYHIITFLCMVAMPTIEQSKI